MQLKSKGLLVRAVKDRVDVLVSPPSDHAWQPKPYREALLDKFPDAADLTSCFSRTGTMRASTKAAFDEVLASLAYKPTGHQKDYRRVLIVDDTFNRGFSARVPSASRSRSALPSGRRS